MGAVRLEHARHPPRRHHAAGAPTAAPGCFSLPALAKHSLFAWAIAMAMMQENLDRKLQEQQARETGICSIRDKLYSQCFGEPTQTDSTTAPVKHQSVIS